MKKVSNFFFKFAVAPLATLERCTGCDRALLYKDEREREFSRKKRSLTLRQTAPRFPRSKRPSTIGSTVKHRARATSAIRCIRSSETKGETASMISRDERRRGAESPPPSAAPAAAAASFLPSKAKVPVSGKRMGEAAISWGVLLCARRVCVASREPRRARLECCCFCFCFCCCCWRGRRV